MLTVLTTTSPIFFLILLGYLGVRWQFIPKVHLLGLSRFVLYFALPALILTKLLAMDMSQAVDARYLAIYAIAGISVFIVTLFISRWATKESWDVAGISAIGATMPNSSFIGVPILMQLFDPFPSQAFVMALMVENILLLPMSLLFIETFVGRRQRQAHHESVVLPVLKRVASNPIIIAVFVGALGSFLGLSLPTFAQYGLGMLSQAAAPAALVVIGGSLVGVTIKGSLGKMSLVATMKLVIYPLLVFLLLQLTPTMAKEMQIALLLFAAMPMLSIYPIIGEAYGQRNFCASTLLITTVLSFISLTLLLRVVI